jgi:hypothetical protein
MARIALLQGLALLMAAQDGPPALDDSTLKPWLEFILPTPDESKWERIGWRTEFFAAAQEAKALQRPVLLWAMNGHPCGLT